MTELVVAICTYRRDSLANAIRSVDAQGPLRASRILIIDNDEAPTAKPMIDGLLTSIRTPLEYLHMPGRNIALARNAALEHSMGNRLAFLDDDETAAPDWLLELNTVLSRAFGAVMGPQIAVYPDTAPTWMTELSPHSHWPKSEDGIALTGHTANCLIDLSHPVMAEMRFDEALGRRGGSDSAYFAAARKKGVQLGYAPDAHVFEPVPAARMSRRWLLRRRWRVGEVLADISEANRASLILTAFAKTGWCVGAAALSVWSPARFHKALFRGAMHAGMAAGASGIRLGEYYREK
ncbi:glycosyltransferase family A protein [Parvularcula marina]|uniref:Glycosyltransferase family 2 protein n=1 Tax=Parvularcula marina TaxID=2292771 RepID=A0A371RI10_9PROT|nr:glycosyltransferase family A protein [Parvularcula marina]RFB05078.1 glycosyltransferase family 2 protein [Parvularcula marina]